MTEQDRPLTAAEEAAVRRALAQARHDGPIPPDVAARLDGVLAELTAERSAAAERLGTAEPSGAAEPSPDALVDLDARRRRRRLTQALVAAAAVVAVGVTVPQFLANVVGPMSGADESASSTVADGGSDAGADDAGGAAEVAPEAAQAPDGAADEASGSASSRHQDAPEALLGSPTSIDASSFRRDARRLDRAARAADGAAQFGAVAGCAATVDPAALTIAVTYVTKGTETPSLLAITPADPDGRPRVASLYVCATGDLIREAPLNGR